MGGATVELEADPACTWVGGFRAHDTEVPQAREGPSEGALTVLRNGRQGDAIKSGNAFRVGGFLDVVRLSTRTMHPMGCIARAEGQTKSN